MPKTMKKIPYSEISAPQILLSLLKIFDPNSKVLTSNNFHFALAKIFKGKRIIFIPDTNLNGLPHLEAETIIQKKLKDKALKSNQDQCQAFQVLASEYKIHLMPKPEYMLPVVAEFLMACCKCPTLLEHIHSFKIRSCPLQLNNIPAGTAKKLIIPQMVIYLNLGKTSANVVLTKLYELYSEFDIREIGLGIAPRYSFAVNGLLSYAQGGGDVKNTMSESQKDTFLSQSEVHFNLPDQHLENPALDDLKQLAKSLAEISESTPLKFQDIQIQEEHPEYRLPHICMTLVCQQDLKNPNAILEEDFLRLNKFSNILERFNLKGKMLDQHEMVELNQKPFFKFQLLLGLPGDLELLRGKRETFITACINAFSQPSQPMKTPPPSLKIQKNEEEIKSIDEFSQKTKSSIQNSSSVGSEETDQRPRKRRKLGI